MGTRSAIRVPEGQVLKEVGFRPIVDVGLYTFTVESFRITDTRSLHNDTDYVSLAVVVGLNPPITVPAKSMGDVNNGTHTVNLSIPNVAVGPNDAVAFTYSIVNSGYSSNLVEEALQKAVSAASSKAAAAAAGAVGGALGGPAGSIISTVGTAAFGWLAGKLEGVIFPNCDGVVAGADHAFTGEQLVSQTANGRVITATDLNKGSNSPDGCGSNSVYYVTWSISTQPPTGSGSTGGGGRISTGNPPHHED